MFHTAREGEPRTHLRRLAIFGAGGHGRELAWLARACFGDDLELTFIVDYGHLVGTNVDGIVVRHVEDFARESSDVPVAVAIGDPRARETCASACARLGLGAATLVHPRVELSRSVSVAGGAVVCAGSVLTVDVQVGRHVHVNVGCTVSHDVVLGDYTTLSPGVHIAGWVKTGRRVFIGTGAVVVNGSSDRPRMLGDDAVVGAGACVTRDVDPGALVVGVPAKPMTKDGDA